MFEQAPDVGVFIPFLFVLYDFGESSIEETP
jgi:hypothetical protein